MERAARVAPTFNVAKNDHLHDYGDLAQMLGVQVYGIEADHVLASIDFLKRDRRIDPQRIAVSGMSLGCFPVDLDDRAGGWTDCHEARLSRRLQIVVSGRPTRSMGSFACGRSGFLSSASTVSTNFTVAARGQYTVLAVASDGDLAWRDVGGDED